MRTDSRVLPLLERMLTEQVSAEEVCQDCPELLDEVRSRFERMQSLAAEVEAIFPAASDVRLPLDAPGSGPAPQVPGYAIEGVLGRGGMGVVYLARQLRLGRRVALKMLAFGPAASARDLARFRREAELLAGLQDPGIVQILDVGEVDGCPYFSMEYVSGGNLAESIARRPLTVRRCAALVVRLASAVQSAHDCGVLHRDLKPSNVLLAADGSPKISDFGLASRMGHAHSLTLTGTLLGTPSYMAPEQASSGNAEIGTAADVYSLGAILYELLTGRPPFTGATLAETQLRVLHEEPAPPSRVRAHVPRDLETICLKCLHKRPDGRYASARALAEDLERFLAHEPILARRLGPLGRGTRWVQRHPTLSVVGVIPLVLVGLFVNDYATRRALAREREQAAQHWGPTVEQALASIAAGEFRQARIELDRVPEDLTAEMRERVTNARKSLVWIASLEDVRLARYQVSGGKYDQWANLARADQAYAESFAAAGIATPGEDVALVVERLRASPVLGPLVGVLDDWAICTSDPARRAWLVDILDRVDPVSGVAAELRRPNSPLQGESLAELARDLPLEGLSVQCLVGLAYVMSSQGLEVIPFLKRVQDAYPGDFWVNLELGRALLSAPGSDAIRFLQSAVALRPDSVFARVSLGMGLVHAGRIEEAIALYRAAIESDPSYADAHAEYGMALIRVDDHEGAIRELKRAVELSPNSGWIRNNLGNELWARGDQEAAIAEFRESARVQPESPAPAYSLAWTLNTLRRFREALPHAQRAARLEPSGWGCQMMLGSSLAGLDRVDEAVVAFRAALQLEPDNVDSRRALATALLRSGNAAEALDLLRAIAELQPADHAAWDGLVEVGLYTNNRAGAVKVCAEMLARFGSSDDPHVCERLGRACLLVDDPELSRRGAELIDRALAADPSRREPWALPYFMVAKALAEYRAGALEAALGTARDRTDGALHPAPEFVKALAQHGLGAKDEARATYASAVLGTDWSPLRAENRETLIYHLLRREAERVLFPELASLLEGREEPRSVAQFLALAMHQRAAGANLAAARWLERAVAAERSLFFDGAHYHRFHGVLVAAAAANGEGVDAHLGTPEARRHWNEVARDWLQSELADLERIAQSSPALAAVLRERLQKFENEPGLAGVRDDSELARLEPAARDAWVALWSRGRELRERLAEADRR